MNNILTDILGMLKRREISKVENGDFIPFARYRKNLRRNKGVLEEPKVITRITKAEDLVKYVEDSIPKGYLVYTGVIEDFGSGDTPNSPFDGEPAEWTVRGGAVNAHTSVLVAPRNLKIIAATAKMTGNAVTFSADADFEFKIWTSDQLANGRPNDSGIWTYAGSLAKRWTVADNGNPGFVENLSAPLEIPAGTMFSLAATINAGSVSANVNEVEVSFLVELP